MHTYWIDILNDILTLNFSHLRPATLSPLQFNALSLRCGRVLTDITDVSVGMFVTDVPLWHAYKCNVGSCVPFTVLLEMDWIFIWY